MNPVDRMTAWWIDRVTFARERSAMRATRRDTSVQLAATFMERLGTAGSYAQETMDVDAAQRLAVTSSWVYSDIQLIAGRIAAEAGRPVAAKYIGDDWEEFPEHPMTQLIAKPNGLMGGAFMIRYLVWWYLLSGNSYVFISTPGVGRGDPLELWPLVANKISPLPGTVRDSRVSDGMVIDYEYSIMGQSQVLPGEHVVHFRTPNPWDYWQGLSPLTGIWTAIQSDINRAKWDRDFFGRDNAIPTAVISLPENMTDADFDRAQEEIRSEFGGRRRTAITRAGDLTIQTVQQTLEDMQLLEGREVSRQEIDRVLGVPDGLFTSQFSGSSRQALESIFAVNTIQPMLDYFAEEWSAKLAPFYGEDGLVAYAKNIVPRDKALAVQEYTIYSQDRTINENRQEQGLPEIDNPLAELVPVRLLQWVAPTYPTVDGEEPEKEPPQPQPAQLQQTPQQQVEEPPQVGSLADSDAPQNVVAQEAMRSANGSGPLTAAVAEGVKAELKRWQTVALRELRAGRRPEGRVFASDVIPGYVAEGVKIGLVLADTEDDIRDMFKLIVNGESEQAIDDAIDTEASDHAPEVLDMTCPLCQSVGVNRYLDHGGLCVCRSCDGTFDPEVVNA